jgi:8-amino-7-oxononanoate synthase
MQSASSFQRRKHPRVFVQLQATITAAVPKADSAIIPCQIIDLSRYGIQFEADQEIPCNAELALISIVFLNLANAVVGLKILRERPLSDGKVMYAGGLSFTHEDTRRKIHTLLRTLASNNIADRRREERRHIDAPPKQDRRRQRRRRQLGIFSDCISFTNRLDAWRASYFHYQRVESRVPGRASINGQELISFASKDYLGLTHHPRVKEAAIRAVARYGTSTTGSRALNGTHPLHEELEREIADFKGTEAALIFPGGYFANVAILSGLLKKEDIVFADEDVHASIIDGCVTGGAKVILFRHNSFDNLSLKLNRYQHDRRLIIVEGVYSVNGDLGCLPKIHEVAESHQVPLMVDDGHGFGVLGNTGSGAAEHFNLTDRIDLDMGICSAALAGIGGFVACKKYVRDYLLHFSRGILFTTSLTPGTTAGILEALRVIRTEPSLRAKLWSNVRHLKSGLLALGYDIFPTESAIISIPVGDEQKTYKFAHMLKERGIYVNTFRRPAVKRGQGRLRLSVSAAHSEADIAAALDVFRHFKHNVDLKGCP